MKVIVTYDKFYNISIFEDRPEVIVIKENSNPQDTLRKLWEETYKGALTDNYEEQFENPLDEENCWIEDDIALITWSDGDVREFYIIDTQCI